MTNFDKYYNLNYDNWRLKRTESEEGQSMSVIYSHFTDKYIDTDEVEVFELSDGDFIAINDDDALLEDLSFTADQLNEDE